MTKKENITKDESLDTKDYLATFKSNEKLKLTLDTALKSTSKLMNNTMPRLTIYLLEFINEYKEKTKGMNKTDDNDLIQKKALREYCYSLVNYDKKEKNNAFEMVITRSIKLAFLKLNFADEFDIDEKTNEVYVMSKVATPFIVEKLEGQKVGTKKRANTSTEMIPVHTGIVDRLHRQKMPQQVSLRKPKTKDEKPEYTFKDIAREFKKYLTKSIGYVSKKDVQFFDYIDDSVVNELKAIKTLLDSGYNSISQFNAQYQVDIDGEQVEKRVA